MRIGVFLMVLICFFGSEWARADFSHSQIFNSVTPFYEIMYAANDSGNAKPKINRKKAASKAKRAYPDSKILSVKLIKSGGPTVYKLKMLSSDGIVKYVFVDGQTGSVFE
ncbi:MAG: PepSY domain-containing protein [Pseudomonadales bacterium]|nr:PepSY domain-containing protein [Pseudomonadales bacterium]